MKHTKVRLLFTLGCVLGMAAFSLAAQAQVVVNMNINASQTGLDITTPGNCPTSNGNGCIKASGRTPINFNLTGDRNCSAGGTWELDYVALGMAPKSVGDLQPPVVPGDFNADPVTGVVTPDRQTDSQIQMRNYNSAAYTVWYTVYATCGSLVIDTDPRIENDGSGR